MDSFVLRNKEREIRYEVKGMVKLKFWDKDSDKVRHGDYIYKQPS